MPWDVKQTSILVGFVPGLHLCISSHSGCFGRGFTSTRHCQQRSQQHLAPAAQKLHSTLSELAMPRDSEAQ